MSTARDRRTTRDLSDRHEAFLAKLTDGRVTPGSGNQPANQADVRGDVRRQPFAFALDGKSTAGGTISVKLLDWRKIQDQAHDEIPAMGLRWYLNGQLRDTVDLVLIDAETFAELLHIAREGRA